MYLNSLPRHFKNAKKQSVFQACSQGLFPGLGGGGGGGGQGKGPEAEVAAFLLTTAHCYATYYLQQDSY